MAKFVGSGAVALAALPLNPVGPTGVVMSVGCRVDPCYPPPGQILHLGEPKARESPARRRPCRL